MNAERLGALTGVAFVLVLIAGFAVVGEPPTTDDSVQEIVDFYSDNEDAVYIGVSLSMIAGLLIVAFGAYLRKVFRAAEGEGHMLSTVVLGGAIVFAAGIGADATLSVTMAETVDDVEPATMQTLNALWNNDWPPFAMGALIIAVASGLSILRHGALPKWLGWVAIVLAVITVTPIGFAGFIGTGLWIVIVSVMLAMRAGSTSTA